MKHIIGAAGHLLSKKKLHPYTIRPGVQPSFPLKPLVRFTVSRRLGFATAVTAAAAAASAVSAGGLGGLGGGRGLAAFPPEPPLSTATFLATGRRSVISGLVAERVFSIGAISRPFLRADTKNNGLMYGVRKNAFDLVASFPTRTKSLPQYIILSFGKLSCSLFTKHFNLLIRWSSILRGKHTDISHRQET